MRDVAAQLDELVRRGQRPCETAAQRKQRRKYEAALRRHEADIERARQSFHQQLLDPDANESLGLPRELGGFATDVLAHTRALDKVGPKRPRRDRYTAAT